MSKILLVEDNEMNRDMLQRRLLRQGYEVVLAMDGEQAVAIALSEQRQMAASKASHPHASRLGTFLHPKKSR